jgi:ssDNA-binding Zn-finger/Zn-ribbon topoisomerase 1
VRETPWQCPECGYRPAFTEMRMGALFYDTRDCRERCPHLIEQSRSGKSKLNCPHLDSIKSRTMMFG